MRRQGRFFEALCGVVYLIGYIRGKRQAKQDLKEIANL